MASDGYSSDENGFQIFNPHGKPVDELPVIYGFNNGGARGFMHAQLIAEDGAALGSHLCSHEGFMPGDLGIRAGSRADRHATFREHYPDGYRMDFVSRDGVLSHAALTKAFELNKAQAAVETDAEQSA